MPRLNNILPLSQHIQSFKRKIYGRIPPHLLWKKYAKLCRTVNLDKSYFILSFDCDTEDDIKVGWDVHSRLMDMGIMPVYAVPGALLQRGEKVYKRIYETGAEFINHGGREHTYFDHKLGDYASCFFYEKQPLYSLKEDIVTGHQILKNVLGLHAKGWRTPHFGTFQLPEHLKFLYSVLEELDYTFSTSTVPQKLYKVGPLNNKKGIVEIAVTGRWTEPLNILDTWGYFRAPDRQKDGNDYFNECLALKDFAKQYPILINIYGDPSHIHKEPLFFESMKNLNNVSKNCNFSEFLKIIN